MSPKSTFVYLLTLAGLVLSFTVGATGSDVGKESRWAEQVVDSLLDGDEVWIDDGNGHEFLGILTEADGESQRAVLLLHGIGVHPNWPDVIYPLRTGLLERDVTTLSIQMPILANDAEAISYAPLFAEVPQRIDAALQALNAAGYSKVTLVAHSMGAAMAVYYLAQPTAKEFDTVVLIGMSPGLDGQENIARLERLRLPVFDLYGSEDLEGVLASADARAAAGQRGGMEYRQRRVAGASHFFQGKESELVEQVFDWYDAQPGVQSE